MDVLQEQLFFVSLLNVIPLSLLLPLLFFFLSLMPQSLFVSFFPSHTSLP